MQFFEHLKIAQKLTLSFFVLVAVVVLMAIVSFSAINDIKSADQESEQSWKFDHAYQLYQQSFSEQRQGLLHYLLTGDRAGLEKYTESEVVMGTYFTELQQLSAHNAELSSLVNRLAALKQEWKSQFAEKQIQLMRNYLSVNEARAIEVTGLPQEVIAHFDETAQLLSQKLNAVISASIEMKASAITRFSITIIVSIAVLVAVAIFFGLALSKVIAGPIGRITHTMSQLADGNLDVEIDDCERKDEIGGMARAVKVFKENAIVQRELQSKEAEKQEQDRLRHERMDQLAADFDQKMQNGLSIVSHSVTNVTNSASTMAGNAVETGALSQDASIAIEEASANIQTVSSASTQLTSSISEISRQMGQASEVSQAAVQEIERTNTRVIALNEAANSIGQVVQIISDIADQTNLLALNATIESARAGEAGKGFAVVASEVKNLAKQTGQATEEITQKVNEIQNETGAAAEAVLGIGETIRTINQLTGAVATAVEEQGAATSEIARNVDEAAQGANQVSSVMQSVAQAADETGKLAEGQKSIIEELGHNNEGLKNDISTFLTAVKSL